MTFCINYGILGQRLYLGYFGENKNLKIDFRPQAEEVEEDKHERKL